MGTVNGFRRNHVVADGWVSYCMEVSIVRLKTETALQY